MNTRIIEEILDKIFFSNCPENEFYYYLNTNKDFYSSINTIFPEIKKCATEPQNTKWHIYNVLDHTLHSIKSVNKLSSNLPEREQKLLSYTMFYHDLGKPKAIQINNEAGHPNSFAYHQEVSAEIVKRTISSFSFNKEEQEKIYTLVKFHDFFMLSYKNLEQYINNEEELIECIKDDIALFSNEELNKDLLEELVLVAKADNMAQNPEMVKPSLEFLDRYERVLNEITFDNKQELAEE